MALLSSQLVSTRTAALNPSDDLLDTHTLPPVPPAASPYDLTDYHARAMRLVQNHTMITLGQNNVFQGALNECNDFSRTNLIAGNATNAASWTSSISTS